MWNWLKKTLKIGGAVAKVAAPVVVEVAVKNPRSKLIADGIITVVSEIEKGIEADKGNPDGNPMQPLPTLPTPTQEEK